jgi:Fe-S-cluster containining protein
MSPEYLELRRAALFLNSAMNSNHPCKAGLARCCTADASISPDDQQNIREGIHSGEIPQSIVEEAIRRAKLPQNKKCGFLNMENRCSIYPRRPLLCIATGVIGIPRPAGALERILANPETRSKGVAFEDLGSTMCYKCHEILAARGVRITYSAFLDSQKIYKHYLRNNTIFMRDFMLGLEQEQNPPA